MKKLVKNTALISMLTFCSRILGVTRDALIAMVFGVSSHSDAFFIAFRPYDLVRKLFSEGILSISFIPVFSRTLEKEGRKKAFEIVFSIFCFLSLVGVMIAIAGMLFAPAVLNMIAPGFGVDSYEYSLTIVLLKIMLPYFWFILMTALCMGILNCFGHYGIPALAPVIFNLIVILFTIWISQYFDSGVFAIAVGVTIGGLCQLAIQLPAIFRLGLIKQIKFKLFHPGAVEILKKIVPGMIGAASYQVNIMVASFFASTLEEGSVSFLYYADRLVQFPLALFAVSVATVFLPELTKKVATNQLDQAGHIFASGVKLVLFITIPAMAGLIALNESIVALLFGRGMFDAFAVHQTAQCLFYLVSGLWAFTCVRLFVTLFFAMGNIKTPFYSGVISIGLNLLLCFGLIEEFGLNGLVLSVSISAMAGFLFLFFNLPGVVKRYRLDITLSACRSIFLSVMMFFLVKQVSMWVPKWQINASGFVVGTIGCIGVGILFYLGLNYLISSPEFLLAKKGMRKE